MKFKLNEDRLSSNELFFKNNNHQDYFDRLEKCRDAIEDIRQEIGRYISEYEIDDPDADYRFVDHLVENFTAVCSFYNHALNMVDPVNNRNFEIDYVIKVVGEDLQSMERKIRAIDKKLSNIRFVDFEW